MHHRLEKDNKIIGNFNQASQTAEEMAYSTVAAVHRRLKEDDETINRLKAELTEMKNLQQQKAMTAKAQLNDILQRVMV